MKNIEDVIKAYECKKSIEDKCNECPYFFECDDKYHCECEARDNDVLHYLKEYHEHLKWQAYEEHCLAEEKKKIKQAYEQGYVQAKHDDEVSRSWEESYRQSQIPWNHYTEMGG